MSCDRLALDTAAVFESCQKNRLESFASNGGKKSQPIYDGAFTVGSDAYQVVRLFDALVHYDNGPETFIAWCDTTIFPSSIDEAMDQTIGFLRSPSAASMPLQVDSLMPILWCLFDGLASGRFLKASALLTGIADTIRYHSQIASDEDVAISTIAQLVDSIAHNTIPADIRETSARALISDVRHLELRKGDEVLNVFKKYMLKIVLAISGDHIEVAELFDCNFKAVAFVTAINPKQFTDAARKFLVSSSTPLEGLVGSVIVGDLKDVPVFLEKFVGTFKSFDKVTDFETLIAVANVADSYGAFLATREDEECRALYARNRIVQKYIVELLKYKHVSPSVGNDLAVIYSRWSPLMDARAIEAILETIVANPMNAIVTDLSMGELSDEKIGTVTVKIHNLLSAIKCMSDDFLGPKCATQHSIRDATLQLCGSTDPIRALFTHVDQLLVHVENETAQSATSSFIKMGCYREGLDVALGALDEARYGIAYGCFEALSDAYLSILGADRTDAVLAHPIFTHTGEGLYNCSPQLIATIRDCYSSSNIEPIVKAYNSAVLSQQCTTICEYLQLSVSMYRVLGLGGSVVPPIGGTPVPQSECEAHVGATWTHVVQGVCAALGSHTITQTILDFNVGAKCYIIECGIMALQQPEYLSITTPAEQLKVRTLLQVASGALMTECPFLPSNEATNITRIKASTSKLLYIHAPYF